MPTTDPVKLRAKADRRNARQREARAQARAIREQAKADPTPQRVRRTEAERQRRAKLKAEGKTPHKRTAPAKEPEYVFKFDRGPMYAPPDLDNPIMAGGTDLIAECTEILLGILPLHQLDDLGTRPEWIHWEHWFNAKYNNPVMYDIFGDPDRFKPTPDGFLVKRERNPHPQEYDPFPTVGNFRRRLYTFQDNYGETFVGCVTSASPGLWSMPREYWEAWGWVAEDYNAFGYLDTLNREHLEHGRYWKIRERGPWWLTNVPGAFKGWNTWSKHFNAPGKFDFNLKDDPVREANQLWKNWVYLVADFTIPSHRSQLLAVFEKVASSPESIPKPRSKDDHNYSPGGPTAYQLIAATLEWIGRERPPSSYRPPSNTFPEVV